MRAAALQQPVPAVGRPPPLRLGALWLAPPVVQAPMSALSNLPLRTLAGEHGCALAFTEFLPAAALAAGHAGTMRKVTASHGRWPFGVQIYGREPGQLNRAAALATDLGASVVDLNMGCPTRKVTRGVCGCALMREPALAAELVAAVRAGVARRAAVTVKIRAGWDDSDRNAPDFARLMVDAGAQAVTVHGRTRAQGFGGAVDLEIIRRVKCAVSVPVIANGDIVDVASLEHTLRITGADGAMIGRAALGNPWLFSTFRAWYRGDPAPPPPPTPAERMAMYLRHLDLYLEIADERRAILEMRKFAAYYLRSVPAGERLRQQINRLQDLAAIRQLVARAIA